MKKILFITLSCLLISCKSCAMIKIIYTDGNNNSYVITADSIKYRPISKAMSSSGKYSGGVPDSAIISKEEFEEIKKTIDMLVSNKSIQVDKREMGTAMIIIEEADKKKKIIFERFSPETEKLEQYLKSLLTEE